MTETLSTLKTEIQIERLLNKKVKASLGAACGVGKSEREARAACEDQVVDYMVNNHSPRIEIRQGYLIVSQVESSKSAWYLIRRIKYISDQQDGFLHPMCFLSPKKLKAAIETHLTQCMADDSRY